MTRQTSELLEASDAAIDDAVGYADPLALRGILYQLTGDEELTTVRLTSGRGGRGRTVQTVAEPPAAATRHAAAEFGAGSTAAARLRTAAAGYFGQISRAAGFAAGRSRRCL